ncbi:outer membrane immunogenic protein [Bradyrhizobium diazoefficiens]
MSAAMSATTGARAPRVFPSCRPIRHWRPRSAALVAAGSFPTALSPSAKGVIGGVQAGYNWQVAPQWLVGLEADFQGADVKGTTTQALAPVGFDATSTTVSKGIDWFGTVRGRVGVLVAPQWLLYGTGGFAYGRTKSSFSTTDVTGGCIVGATICASGASSGTSTGWTAGAGTEVMFAPNWSFKAEYLYVDLGRRTLNVASSTVPAIVFTTSTPFREQIARVGVNYHFSAGPVVAKYWSRRPGSADPVHAWPRPIRAALIGLRV